MRGYRRTKSWSEIARRICDQQVDLINNGWGTIAQAREYFTWRNDIICKRAVKRFGKMMRAGKVHENFKNENSYFSDLDHLD